MTSMALRHLRDDDRQPGWREGARRRRLCLPGGGGRRRVARHPQRHESGHRLLSTAASVQATASRRASGGRTACSRLSSRSLASATLGEARFSSRCSSVCSSTAERILLLDRDGETARVVHELEGLKVSDPLGADRLSLLAGVEARSEYVVEPARHLRGGNHLDITGREDHASTSTSGAICHAAALSPSGNSEAGGAGDRRASRARTAGPALTSMAAPSRRERSRPRCIDPACLDR